MTRRISLVAVCCSNASVRSRLRSCNSLNSRTFSMAITAWSAKVFEKCDLLVGERTNLRAANTDGADRNSFSQQRRGKSGSSPSTAE